MSLDTALEKHGFLLVNINFIDFLSIAIIPNMRDHGSLLNLLNLLRSLEVGIFTAITQSADHLLDCSWYFIVRFHSLL